MTGWSDGDHDHSLIGCHLCETKDLYEEVLYSTSRGFVVETTMVMIMAMQSMRKRREEMDRYLKGTAPVRYSTVLYSGSKTRKRSINGNLNTNRTTFGFA